MRDLKEDGVENLVPDFVCPLCCNRLVNGGQHKTANTSVFGYGLDFRLVPRYCDRSFEVVTCPDCLYTSHINSVDARIPGHIKELVGSAAYRDTFKTSPSEAHKARSWLAYVSILEARGLNPRDLGIAGLRGSWMARELDSLGTEGELLAMADAYLDDALRRGLTKGDPGMIIYLLGEINRRRGEFLRAREMLTFLGNNPRYRYAALLLTVLVEEEDTTPYWSRHAPDKMEQHSPRFRGLFPALRSIPPGKTEFYPDELSEPSERPD